MPTRSYKPEQIVAVLRQIEVQMGNGKTAACKEAGIHTQTYTGGGRNTRAESLQLVVCCGMWHRET